ncbi:ribosomal protein S5 domain 2-type protein [Melampsora americana]|nr:ribosomal protein S5 domain 2-type protein [Melampsora americana]
MDSHHTFPSESNGIESSLDGKTIDEWVAHLASKGKEDLSLEISTLAAILGDQSIKIFYDDDLKKNDEVENERETQDLFILVINSFHSENSTSSNEEIRFSIKICVPNNYPEKSSIRFQLISKYIGPYLIQPELFDQVSKLYQDDNDWTSSQSILFDALESIKEIIVNFYNKKYKELHESDRVHREEIVCEVHEDDKIDEVIETDIPVLVKQPTEIFRMFVSEPIVDRKSTFVGHATSLKDPAQVKAIMNQILSDKKVARATHNMYAWRCELNGHLHQDNDDDGESAAGSRMQHLLNIMDVKNVLVCVSRWFGGIHLGSDRFKHINQATRDALIVGNFLDSSISNGSSESKSNHHKKKKH